MPTYNPPLRDMQFVMHEVLNVVGDLKQLPAHAEMDVDTINAVLEEGGKFASEVIFPLNISGDAEGCTIDQTTHAVTTPKGFKEAYKTYVDGGWAALACDPAFGGQGLPFVVNQMFYEMLNSANQAWAMYPGLTHGAYAALDSAWNRRAKADLPAQDDQRRVDGHHVPDRTTLRNRPGSDAHQG
jgi:alkylation response protein AidB-like acyl-CoA dehydrogenase